MSVRAYTRPDLPWLKMMPGMKPPPPIWTLFQLYGWVATAGATAAELVPASGTSPTAASAAAVAAVSPASQGRVPPRERTRGRAGVGERSMGGLLKRVGAREESCSHAFDEASTTLGRTRK